MDRTEKLKVGAYYPLGDRLPLDIQRQLTADPGTQIPGLGVSYDKVRAQWDGRPRRCPKQGEWYLSGAVITAYRAPNDLPTAYHIAVLVEGEFVPARFVARRVLEVNPEEAGQ